MTDRENPPVNEVQPSALESVVDRPAAEPEAGELDAGDNTVLAFRERGDRGVQLARMQFSIYDMHNCMCVDRWTSMDQD